MGNEGNFKPEKELIDHPNSINKNQLRKILFQMEKCICRIYCSDGSKGTGFFCRIPFPDSNDYKNPLKVLITNNHILNQKDIEKGRKIEIYINDENIYKSIFIDENRLAYTLEDPIDVTFIEIKPKDNIDEDSYLELDDNVFDINKINSYLQNTVYLLHYPKGSNAELSVGKIKNIAGDTYKINHYCETQEGSSGSPIINLVNLKVIGVHKGTLDNKNRNYNIGILLKGPIEKFYQKNKVTKSNDVKIIREIAPINNYINFRKMQNIINSVCKIIIKDKGFGTGFFCFIPFPDNDNKIPALITCNHILNENDILKGNKINFLFGQSDSLNTITIEESRKKFTHKELDFTIIEIKSDDNIDSNYFLEIDQIVLNNDNFYEYLKNSLFHFIGINYRKTIDITDCRLKEINNFHLYYYCSTNVGFSGAPLINLSNNKVIGINLGLLGESSNYNIGTIIKYIVKEFLKFYLKK